MHEVRSLSSSFSRVVQEVDAFYLPVCIRLLLSRDQGHRPGLHSTRA
jgi:hypothetical protein